MKKIRGCSLIDEVALGRTEPEVKPGGTDVDLAVVEIIVLGVHGHSFGVTKLEVSLCVPPQGMVGS